MGAIFLHTKSFFLAGFGMLQILLSMPCALFFYRTLRPRRSAAVTRP
jgi:hypothetical protein